MEVPRILSLILLFLKRSSLNESAECLQREAGNLFGSLPNCDFSEDLAVMLDELRSLKQKEFTQKQFVQQFAIHCGNPVERSMQALCTLMNDYSYLRSHFENGGFRNQVPNAVAKNVSNIGSAFVPKIKSPRIEPKSAVATEIADPIKTLTLSKDFLAAAVKSSKAEKQIKESRLKKRKLNQELTGNKDARGALGRSKSVIGV